MAEDSKNYNNKDAELNWKNYWEEQEVYKFNPDDFEKEVFSVDTPPPTISGKMHLGHAFSYSQQDFIVRYQRMRGKNVFYPFGTDNNGVATERLIEKLKKVRAKDMDRDAFIKLCLEAINQELKPVYVNDMKKLGLSCDFNLFYDTIDNHSQKISQESFIDLYHKGKEYRKDAPTMWCPTCETGISQVECEDKELDSFFNDIIFKTTDEEGKETDLVVATTRPELLPACVAVFYHPTDIRYQKYKGKKAKVPLFDFEVEIRPDERADPQKGTGIVMCCTFGDQTDMEWQKAHNLPIKMAISADGRMTELAQKYKGLKIGEARKQIIKEMKELGLLTNQKQIKHAVNVHERCGTEIEFLKSKQWFIKYLDQKEDMLLWGAELNWHPEHMKVRYDNWVKGLQWDWMISRQRYFGVPFPVWYCKKCDEVILADEKQLPVDPLKTQPLIQKCPKCGGHEFIPEKDVMDTWATSSLTPQIATKLVKNEKMQKRLYPMSLRPQAHDIITFWLFNTVVKSRLHNDVNPWKDVVISGHAQDPHGKKMSKSKGNVVEPQVMIEKYSSDALRFWAGGSKLGDDLPFQEKDLVTGQKMIVKMWNSVKFSIMHLQDYNLETPEKFVTIDLWALSQLQELIKNNTTNFDNYEYSKVKAETEKFFYKILCDNYLEIIKDRIYNPANYPKDEVISAKYTIYHLFLSIIKMMAPFMPFITEEVYQQYFAKKEGLKSVHNAEWPKYYDALIDKDAEASGDIAVEIISMIRKYKTENKLSLKTELLQLTINSSELKDKIMPVLNDIKSTGRIKEIIFADTQNMKSDKYELQIGIMQ